MTQNISSYDQLKEELGNRVASIMDSAFSEALEDNSSDGREPETNGAVSGLVTSRFRRESFDEEKISVKFATFKPHTQEGHTGSDIAVVFEVFDKKTNNLTKSKTTLVQAKVGSRLEDGSISVYDEHLADQLETINKISPDDGFLLIYVGTTCYSVSVQQALSCKISNVTFNFDIELLKNAGYIGRELAICNKGNNKEIKADTLKVKRKTDGTLELNDFVEKLAAYGAGQRKIVLLTTTINPSPNSKLTVKPKH